MLVAERLVIAGGSYGIVGVDVEGLSVRVALRERSCASNSALRRSSSSAGMFSRASAMSLFDSHRCAAWTAGLLFATPCCRCNSAESAGKARDEVRCFVYRTSEFGIIVLVDRLGAP